MSDQLHEQSAGCKAPFVSIIMPVYNAESFLADSIESVIAQTDPDWELICFNDASTDGSLAVLERFADADSRIRVIDSKVNVKQGGGRNRAIERSRGQFIMFLDADDWLRPDAVGLCHQAVNERQADAVFYDLVRVMPSTGSEEIYAPLGQDAATLSIQELKLRIVQRQTSICSVAYARRLFFDTGLWFPEGVFYEDNAVAMAVQLSADRPVKLNAGLYFYRSDNVSVTRSIDDFRFFDRIQSAVLLLGNLKRLGFYDRFRDEIDNVFINQYFIHTVFGCVYRFSKVPMERLHEVRRGIAEHIPNYRQNRYYRALPLSRKLKIELHARFPRIIHFMAMSKRRLLR